MNEHRQAIDDQQKSARIASASTANEKKLAEVETAVVASKTQLDSEAEKLSQQVAADRITPSVAEERMTELRAQHAALVGKMKEDIVDPIATECEDSAKKIADIFKLPQRHAAHIEASALYAALDSDGRQDAITRAVTGKDDLLAEALLTGRDEITDITREQLIKRLKPPGHQIEEAKTLALARRVQATLNTIKGARQ